MSGALIAQTGAGRAAIEREMARQSDDAIASFEGAGAQATSVAQAIQSTGRLLMLGMGASHAAARIVEPLYRALGIDAVALPLSEQTRRAARNRRQDRDPHFAIGRERRDRPLVRKRGAASQRVRDDA